MRKLVLLRHGQSFWNQENRFTGWTDIDLSPKGIQEAKKAAQLLKENGFSFDLAFTSVLKRAIRTLWIVLDEMDQMWIPVQRSWRLNERFYGALQGLNKAETAAKHGEKQVHIWRRSFDTPPPAIEDEHSEYHPGHDPRYAHVSKDLLPTTEALKQTVERVLPYWEEAIVPEIQADKRILISAHGNSLRALRKHLEGISDQDIMSLEIPTGIPFVYELDQNLSPGKFYYLGDPEEVKKAENAVKSQGKAAKP